MGVVILSAIISLLVAFFLTPLVVYDGRGSLIKTIFFSVINGTAMFFASIIAISLTFGWMPSMSLEMYDEEVISALNDSSLAEGSHFLGTGTVEESRKYFYVVEGELGKEVMEVDEGLSYIKELDEEFTEPKLVTYRRAYEGKVARWFFGDWSLWSNPRYQFIIPEGSVTTDFSIDLQ